VPSHSDDAERSAGRWPAALAAAVVLAVAAAAVAVAGWLRAGDDAPPVLGLTGGTARAGQVGEGAGAAPAGGLELRATLPEGPDEAPVWLLGETSDEQSVATLAAALGIDGDVTGEPSMWTVTDGRRVLRVARSAGQPWTYVADETQTCASVPLDPTLRTSPDASVSCAGSGSSQDPAADTSDALLRGSAAPVLRALGYNADDAAIVRSGGFAEVVATPVVEGLRTVGFQTAVAVGRDGVLWAHGWLGGASSAESYPLVSAREAFETLSGSAAAEPATTECIQAPCEAATTAIADVVLGLSLQVDAEGPLLAPAWLFFPEGQSGSAFPLTALAVDPAYLGAPPDTGTDSGSGSTGAPAELPPAPPAQDSASASPVPIEDISAGRTDRHVTLTVSAPPETGPCPTRLVPEVTETDTSITVSVTAVTEGPPAGAAVRCSLETRQVVAQLAEPVGDREVTHAG
jgi:hypothetical protein